MKWLSSSLWGCELRTGGRRGGYVRISHPPCEDVSWKDEFTVGKVEKVGHPPCEDVSWKIDGYWYELDEDVILLVRMWVEKLDLVYSFCVSIVILLVRMWVEKSIRSTTLILKRSSSLWGCELKTFACLFSTVRHRHPPCEDVSWKIVMSDELLSHLVILLVRMWVEKIA